MYFAIRAQVWLAVWILAVAFVIEALSAHGDIAYMEEKGI